MTYRPAWLDDKEAQASVIARFSERLVDMLMSLGSGARHRYRCQPRADRQAPRFNEAEDGTSIFTTGNDTIDDVLGMYEDAP